MKKIEKNNRGAALLMVIIAMAVVSLLGTVILFTAYSGLNMRLVGRTSANTFYSAEAAMDEITAGLEQEMSTQYVAAYTEVMSQYGSFSTVTDMQRVFKSNFILNMVDKLKLESVQGQATLEAGSYLYNVSVLSGYVTGDYGTGATVTVSTADASEANGGNLLQTLEDGLIIRNIKVTLTKNGYSNTIISDIKILVPEVQFSLVSSMPDIQDYTFIADAGTKINGGVTLTIQGNAYSGNTYKVAEDGTASGSTDSMICNTNSKLDATDSSLLIIDGDAVLTASSELLTGGTDTATTKVTTLWADNISAERSNSATNASNKISLLGRSYISDDITLNGSKNELILSGQYYGFCTGNDKAKNSSSIIINGQESTLNFANLDTMVVAGTAFVSASSVTNIADNTKENRDIATGDSIALKANQYAYMVPVDCEGITTNPMSYNQYSALTADGDANGNGKEDWMEAALNTVIPSINKSIASYDAGVTIVPVFSASEGGTVYLYLEFSDVSIASTYFMDVYNSDSVVAEKVKSYMDNYLKAVTFNVDASGRSKLTRLVTGGTYLVPGTYDSASGKWSAAYSNDSSSAGAIASELGTYANIYEALCTKLVTSRSSLSEAEKSRTVYENLIDETALAEAAGYNYTEGASKSGNVVTFTQTGSTTKTLLVFNAGDSAYTTNGGDGLLIATGDVTINGTWNGLILCKGKLTVNGNTTMKSNEDVTAAAMRLGAAYTKADGTTGSISVLNLFRGGENYQLPASAEAAGGKDMTDVRNCIAYENWKSQ